MVLLATLCAAGAVSMRSSGPAFVSHRVPVPPWTQLRAAMDDQKGPVLEAKKSVTLFGVVPVAALAISGLCGLAPVAPVYAELKTVQPSSELSSGKFLLAQDAPLMPAPGAEAPKAADAPVDAPKPKKKKVRVPCLAVRALRERTP